MPLTPGQPPSAIRSRAVDAPIKQDATYEFDANDRAYIDDQVRGLQQHVVQSLVGGLTATWATLDGSGSAGNPGDVVVLGGSASGTVKLAAATGALASAGMAFGVLLQAVPPGSAGPIAIGGLVPPSVTGLAAASGFARVNVSTGRVEYVAGLSVGDYPLGAVDAAGNLSIRPQVLLAAPGTGQTNLTLANGLNSNINPSGRQTLRIGGPTGAFSLGGFTGGAAGSTLLLTNTTAEPMTIVHEDASSASANRIDCQSNGASIALQPKSGSALLMYDTTDSRWVVQNVGIHRPVEYNVVDYGADPTGSVDATSIIKNLLLAAAANGGGVVRIPPGTYKCSDYLPIGTGVFLRGSGKSSTILSYAITGNTIGLSVGANVTDYGASDLTVSLASHAHSTDQFTEINILGTLGNEALRGTFSNIHLDGATFCGFFSSFAIGLQLDGLEITNAGQVGGSLGGVGMWIFKGSSKVRLNGIDIEGTVSDGLAIDSGTTIGGETPVNDVVGAGITIRNFSTDPSVTGGALSLRGANRCHLTGVVMSQYDQTNTLYAHATDHQYYALSIEQNKNGFVARDNFIDCVVDGTGFEAVIFKGAQRNTVHCRAHNPTLAVQAVGGGAQGHAVSFIPTPLTMAGISATDTADNTVHLDVFVDDATHCQYDSVASFVGGLVSQVTGPSTTASNAYRNRVLGRFTSHATGSLVPANLYTSSTSGGCFAPVAGPDANTIDGVFTDPNVAGQDLRSYTGGRLQVQIPGLGSGWIGALNATYLHFATDLPNMYFGGGSNAATAIPLYFNSTHFIVLGSEIDFGGSGGTSMTVGSGAPSSTPLEGSLYLRNDSAEGMAYVRQNGAWLQLAFRYGDLSSIVLTTGTVNLTAAQAASKYLKFTGSLTGNVTIVFPTNIGEEWVVDATSVTLNGHTITLQANSVNWGTSVGVTTVYRVLYGGFVGGSGQLWGTTLSA